MENDESQGDDLILERLRESASGDAAVRQLRRRYDSLRSDYEQLLDRLGELEERLNAEPPATSTPPPPIAPLAVSASLADMILAPLLKLRDDYVAAVSGINSVVSGLESLAAGAFKGQHGGESAAQPAAPQPAATHHVDEAVSQRPRRVQVDVRGRGFGELLDFQERLTSLEGVARVSINAIDTERATLVVELDAAGQQTPDG